MSKIMFKDLITKYCLVDKYKSVSKLKNYDVFMKLIEGYSEQDLENVIEIVSKKTNLTKEQVFQFIQTGENCPLPIKVLLYNSAYECIDSKKDLGNTLKADGYGVTSWITHSLQVARACKILAENTGEDQQKAEILGLVHDIGRKKTHTLEHIPLGYRMLIELGLKEKNRGYISASKINLMHEYLKAPNGTGDRKANCDYMIGEENDDLANFLGRYQYTNQDVIVSIADLIVTNDGEFSPYKRIKDIYTRRNQPTEQKSYFLERFIISLNDILELMTKENNKQIDIKGKNEEELWIVLQEISDKFEKTIKHREKTHE